MENPESLIFIMLLLFLVPIGAAAALSLWALRPWLRATMAGAQLTVFEIIGMRLRRVDVDAVVAALVAARQSGVEIHQIDLQRAYLAGVDLPTITLAWINAQRKEMDLQFEQLVEMYQQKRLGELIDEGTK
ncbi:MAG: flotillin-like FloA family protein [Pirellulales bacterium]